MAIEHNQGHLPVGNGSLDWMLNGAMQSYDVLLHEFDVPLSGGQLWQVAARALGPAYRRPADQPNEGPEADLRPPWYLGPGTRRGKYYAIAYEWRTYTWVRNRVSAATVEAERQQLRRLGFTYVC